MRPISIGLAGLGNVGEEVLQQLQSSAYLNKKFKIGGISFKSKNKKRKANLKHLNVFTNALNLAEDDNIDLVIELIGGDEGVAKDLAFKTLNNNKPFITANKALIAKYGIELSSIAKKKQLFIGLEASVAGGIPVIKVIKESLIANKIIQITGILNGTSNYLLDAIQRKSLNFEKALKQAQDLGYAENDPSFDVNGMDAAHKIAILSAIVFDKLPNFEQLVVKGISDITLEDLNFADKLNYKIKLLAICTIEHGFQCSVEPWLVPKNHSLSNINGVLNAIEIISDLSGPILLTGAGAGPKATASSVLSDLFDYLANSNRTGISNSTNSIIKFNNIKPFKSKMKFYLKVSVLDKSGILADLTSIFKQNKISIQSFYQDLKSSQKFANLFIVTHEVERNVMDKAIQNIRNLKGTLNEIVCISIYD